jgi:cytochrome c oxidase subunit I
MATATAPEPTVLHPRAASFTVAAQATERRLGLLFAGTGIVLVALMGILGLVMRLTQADAIGVSPAWFYRVLTLHGGGMITAVLLSGMGALWYVLRGTVPLRTGWMLTSYALIVVGAVCVLVATLVGGFGAAWTFLPPLSFFSVGQWSTWSESLFFVGMLLVGSGFFVFCMDVLQQTTAAYGGLSRAIGWEFLRGRDEAGPPPQVIAAVVIAIDGLLSMSAGMAIVAGLLGRTYDSSVGFDLLVSKNLVYFFGHTIANLTIYLVAGSIYVILPRYAGRPYVVSKVFVGGWLVAGVFIVSVYSHHLYMDFVQPRWAEIVSMLSSYGSLIPVAVITIYSMTMLVWGSRYRWTLASSLLYVGLVGWAIGGTGAVIDSIIPFNFRLHNTVWVVGHFHTYLMLTVVVWILAFLAHVLERESGQTTSRAARIATIGLLTVGGFGLTGTWFVGGALGIPRRYAIQPPGTDGYSAVGSGFAFVFALGFLVCLVQLVVLARAARERRGSRLPEPAAPAPPATATRWPALSSLPLASPAQLGLGVALCVISVVSFLPQVVDASEAGLRYHHLDHAGHYLFGALAGLVLGSLPAVSRRLGDRAWAGMAAVLLAPMVAMLVMVPRFYEPLEQHAAAHAGLHVAIALLGLATGLGATRLGRVGGRLAVFLSVGMMLMFAAAMTGG